MAKNITLMGANYPDVPAVQLPITGGGVATFVDVDEVLYVYTATLATYINLYRVGKVVMCIMVNGTVTINADGYIAVNGSPVSIPSGYRPYAIFNTMETYQKTRMTFQNDGTIIVENKQSTTSVLRFGATWITQDDFPT